MNITEAHAEIERLKKIAVDAQEQIERLEKLVEEKRPWPYDGCKFTVAYNEFNMDNSGDYFGYNSNYPAHRVLNFTGVMHRDDASKQKHMEIIDRMLELRGDWRADWREFSRNFYIMWYEDAPAWNTATGWLGQGTFYLPSEEACKTLIEEFGDDLRVLFGMPLKREGV